MPDILIVYATTHGHTAKIASRLADAVRAGGATPHVRDIQSAAGISPSSYDGVIVGASVHAGRHQRGIVHWAANHARALDAMPSAFFSVCLTIADDTGEARAAARGYIDAFVEETGWTPRRTATFAGALQYREYGVITRLAMRLLMRRGHHPTDTRRDHEYTDWRAVERFGHECTGLGAGVPAPA